MQASRWDRVKEIFTHASELPAAERKPYLDRACAGDPELRRTVEELLAVDPDQLGVFGRTGGLWPPNPDRPAPAFQTGEVAGGRFEIREFIGRGGMGEVYRVGDELGDEFALKAPLERLLSDEGYLSRFINEIQLSRRVTHPGVCRIFEFGWHRREGAADIPFFTMDLLRGRTLWDRLEQEGKLPIGQLLEIALPMAEGVAALHDEGIFHRDLKPSNVMLVGESDGAARPVLMDFGLARGLDRPGSSGYTITSTIIGTFDYMAPEQRAGGRIGKYTDVYSFGLILQNTISYSAETGPAERRLKHLIRDCTAHDPDDRPQDGSALVKRLKAIGSVGAVEKTSSSSRQVVPLESFTDQETAMTAPMGWRTWAGALVALAAISIPLAWQIPEVREPVADRVCAAWPGSELFCLLPADKDLAILPITSDGGDAEQKLIAAGFARYYDETLFRLYPNRSEYCVHSQHSFRTNQFEKLVLHTNVRVDAQVLSLDANVVRSSDGLTVRTVERSADLDDLEGLRDLPLAILAALETPAEAPRLENWRNAGPHDTASFRSYLRGMGHLEAVSEAPSRWAPAAQELSAAGRNLGFALASVALGDAYRLGVQAAELSEAEQQRLDNSSERAYARAHSADKLAAISAGRGRLHILRGREQAGVEWLSRALAIDPHDIPTRDLLATTLRGQDRIGEAEQALRDGMTTQPECWILNNRLSRIYLDSGRLDEAVTELLRLIELSANNSAAYSNLSRVYLAMGQYPEAIEAGRYALELQENAQRHSNVAQAYLYAGCAEQAIEHFDRSIADPSQLLQYVYVFNRAEGLRFLNWEDGVVESQTREAVRLSNLRLLEDPHDLVALRFLARGRAWLGDGARALEALDRIQKADPDSAVRYNTVAAVWELLGDRDQALAALEQGLDRGLRVNQIRHAAAFRNLVESPRFLNLMRERKLNAPALEPVSGPCLVSSVEEGGA